VCQRIRVAGPCHALQVLAHRASVPLEAGESALRSCCSTYRKIKLSNSDTKSAGCIVYKTRFGGV